MNSFGNGLPLQRETDAESYITFSGDTFSGTTVSGAAVSGVRIVKNFLRIAAILFATFGLASCDSSSDSSAASVPAAATNPDSGSPPQSPPPPASPEPEAPQPDDNPPAPVVRAGEVYDVYITVPGTGDTVAMTVFEPATVDSSATYPLIIYHHGYAGSRVRSLDESCTDDCGQGNEPNFVQYVNNGYGVLSFDQRGHNESTGNIRGMDPDYAGKGLVAMLDWAEANLDWLAYGPSVDGRDSHNPIMGSIGGSYGGISQLILNAIDPKRRMDAIVPEYTWYDFPTALFPNDVLRATMYEGVFAGGIAAGNSANYGPTITEYSLELLSGSRPTPYTRDYWAYHSHSYFCEGKYVATNGGPGTFPELPSLPPPPVHAMVWQGMRDTVFVFNDGFYNAKCLQEQGGDVRFLTYHIGHEVVDVGNDLFQPSNDLPQNRCGSLDKNTASFAFFQEHLKGIEGAADVIPRKPCMSLSVTDAVLVDDVSRGKTGRKFVLPATRAVPGVAQPVVIDLGYTAGSEGEVIAGIPHLQISIDSLSTATPGDEILIFGLGHMRSTTPQIWDLVDNQLWPTRGPGDYDFEMSGIAERLQPGDKLALLIYGAHEQFNITGAVSASQVNVTPVEISGSLWLPLLGPLPNIIQTSQD
ncbi:MAG TPA: hypothetical protein DIW43_02315 [Spongiibacteraceae bacterium]|nr:hypothetical protein [Spongiibacteraceae bacterium]